MRGGRIREKLRAGRPVFTTPLRFHAPRLVEMLARSGVDQVFLDAEHGPLSPRDCEDMVRAADLHDLPVAIRVPVNAPEVVLRYLDIGTSTIVVPHVTDRARHGGAPAPARPGRRAAADGPAAGPAGRPCSG